MAISLDMHKGLAVKAASRARRQLRGHKKVSGTIEQPRTVVAHSAWHLYVQVIDDTAGRTLTSASTMEADLRAAEDDKPAKARKVGEITAQRAREADIENTVFDHTDNRYHGRIVALADTTHEAGFRF